MTKFGILISIFGLVTVVVFLKACFPNCFPSCFQNVNNTDEESNDTEEEASDMENGSIKINSKLHSVYFN